MVNTIIHNNMTNQATEEANYIASTVSSPCLPFLVARLPSKLKSTTATIIMFGWALDSHLGCQSNYSVTNRFAMKSALIPLSKDSHTQHERQCQISIKLNPISSPKNLYPIPPLSSAHQSLHCSALSAWVCLLNISMPQPSSSASRVTCDQCVNIPCLMLGNCERVEHQEQEVVEEE